MSLDAVYAKLGLDPALEWETKSGVQPDVGWDDLGKRRTGTTLQMLVEMYLDLYEANRRVGLQERHKVKFLCITLHRNQSHELRKTFENIHSHLQLDLLLKQVKFITADKIEHDQLRGSRFYSWAVFCDHSVKETNGLARNDGPFRFTRTLEKQGEDRWMAFDRDGEIIGLVDGESQKEILQASPCPITVSYQTRVKPTTYPGFMNAEFNQVVSLSRAFVL
jgi:hypothetical protein